MQRKDRGYNGRNKTLANKTRRRQKERTGRWQWSARESVQGRGSRFKIQVPGRSSSRSGEEDWKKSEEERKMKRKQRQKEDLEDRVEVGDGEEEEVVVDRRREERWGWPVFIQMDSLGKDKMGRFRVELEAGLWVKFSPNASAVVCTCAWGLCLEPVPVPLGPGHA